MNKGIVIGGPLDMTEVENEENNFNHTDMGVIYPYSWAPYHKRWYLDFVDGRETSEVHEADDRFDVFEEHRLKREALKQKKPPVGILLGIVVVVALVVLYGAS